MVKSLQILKAEVLRINFKKKNCQNRLRIDFRNEVNVIEPQKHVHHDNFENFTKSLILPFWDLGAHFFYHF